MFSCWLSFYLSYTSLFIHDPLFFDSITIYRFANSIDPDEMACHELTHLHLHSLHFNHDNKGKGIPWPSGGSGIGGLWSAVSWTQHMKG